MCFLDALALFLLDARASIEIAPRIAQLMAAELKKPKAWEKKQVAEYTKLANHYLIEGK